MSERDYTGKNKAYALIVAAGIVLAGLFFAVFARAPGDGMPNALYHLTFSSFVILLALALGLVFTRAERKLRLRLTETVADLRRAQAEQEQQLRRFRETNMLLEERYAETYALYLIQQELAAELDVDRILPKVADIVLGLLGGRSCSIILADMDRGCLYQAAVSGPGQGGLVLPLAGNPLARSWAESVPLSHDDLTAADWAFWQARGTNGLLCMPISTKSEKVGLILVEYDYLPQSLEDHKNLLSLVAGQLSLALANAYLYRRVRVMATRDELTGLGNRHYLKEKLAAAMETAGQAQPLSAIILDIDFFKTVNDEHGHEAGDEIIRHVGAELAAELGPDVPIARYGGEEFVALLPGVGLEEAVRVAERIRIRIKNHPGSWEGIEIPVTVSLGAASYPHQAKDGRSLLRLADRGLYLAKTRRDMVCVAGGQVPLSRTIREQRGI